MRFLIAIIVTFFFGFLLVSISCQLNADKPENSQMKTLVLNKTKPKDNTPRLKNIEIDTFFSTYPKYQSLRPEIIELYEKHDYNYIWYGKDGVNELAFLLYDKIGKLDEQGIRAKLPYKPEVDSVFKNLKGDKVQNVDIELMISSMYFFYENKVYRGLDSKKTEGYGWYLPRKPISYVARLDSLLANPTSIDYQRRDVLDQYYKLKEVLKNYREIKKRGGWKKIPLPADSIVLRIGDYSDIIPRIKQRLRITGDIESHSRSNHYNKALAAGILKYKKRHGFASNSLITRSLIKSMNISVRSRIETIELNMERCRWISPDLTKADVFIFINIPSFKLTFFRDGEPELISKVVVGKVMNQTVVFSGEMSQIVFSPYWNIPTNILEQEIIPALAINENYLEEQNMEWCNGRVRQRPGPGNALGKVKFIFPNSNAIYLHDTPLKNLFTRDQRAYSHGCIRVERPRDLAISVLKGDSIWTRSKIDAAMNLGKQQTYLLKAKIPVYIGYFTAWVDEDGNINFYNDIYDRDPILVKLMKD